MWRPKCWCVVGSRTFLFQPVEDSTKVGELLSSSVVCLFYVLLWLTGVGGSAWSSTLRPYKTVIFIRVSAGVRNALLAALLFGASAPLSKILLHALSPMQLAGALYLGSGVGLAIWRLTRRLRRNTPKIEASIKSGRRSQPADLLFPEIAAFRVGRRLRCSSVTYRFRYAPSSRLAGGPF